MRKVVLKEGLYAPLFYLGAVILLGFNVGAFAQVVEQSDLERCAGLASTELKLACFESLAASDVAASEAVDENAADSDSDAGVDESVAIAAGATSVAPETAVQSDSSVFAAEEDKLESATATATDSQVVADTEAVDQLGQEHLDDNAEVDEQNVEIQMTVSAVEKRNYGVLYFNFTNGQVWRQIEAKNFRYPRGQQFDVVVNTGMMGEYRMRLESGGAMTRIRRVK